MVFLSPRGKMITVKGNEHLQSLLQSSGYEPTAGYSTCTMWRKNNEGPAYTMAEALKRAGYRRVG